MNGYLDAAKKHGIVVNAKHIITCDTDKEANKILIKNLLLQPDRPDAIFACVEELAVSSYVLCQELKLNIPRDVKIMSFSNLQTAAILNPSLTTITQPAYDIGREAASVLFQLMENEGTPQHFGDIVLNSELIVRNSTKIA
jgi:LacI family transcriptional regulator